MTSLEVCSMLWRRELHQRKDLLQASGHSRAHSTTQDLTRRHAEPHVDKQQGETQNSAVSTEQHRQRHTARKHKTAVEQTVPAS